MNRTIVEAVRTLIANNGGTPGIHTYRWVGLMLAMQELITLAGGTPGIYDRNWGGWIDSINALAVALGKSAGTYDRNWRGARDAWKNALGDAGIYDSNVNDVARLIRGGVLAAPADAAYVATKLPNVPTAERQPLADAAIAAAAGQSFTSRQVIDTLALASECFVFKLGTHIAQNSDGSGAAANGSPIGYCASWVGTAIAIQTSPSAKPVLTVNGANNDGVDDRLFWLTPAAMKSSSGNDRTTYLIFKTSSITRFEPYGTRVSNGGVDNTATGWLYLMSSFATGSVNYAYVGGGNRVTNPSFNIGTENILRARDGVSSGYDIYLNGVLKDSAASLARGTAEFANGYSAIGWQSTSSFALSGTCRLVLGFGLKLSDSQASQMDRLWNNYFNLGVL